MRLPSENLQGFRFLLLGKERAIECVNETRIRFDGERNILFLPIKNARERLVKWLKENAGRILKQRTAEWAEKMNVQYSSVRVTSAKTRWGSCSYKNAINYSFRLIYAPKEIVDYVVVHELAHVRFKNHASAFWKEVETYMPDYREKRAWLKKNGILMRIF